VTTPAAIQWDQQLLALELLDQRLLPESVHYLSIDNLEEACDAISSLAVRGAPAIGIAAAYAMIVCARDVEPRRRLSTLEAAAQRLKSARPTAVNLAWAVDRLLAAAKENPDLDALHDVALAIHAEDREICQAIGRAGQHLIRDGSRVLTHCNAGALAVSELGTATAPMYLSHRAGVSFKVYADETRPLLQGARLTAWELDRAGIDVTLICDSAAASLMAAGQIDLVLVGTDRVTRNGDVVNKIGTLNLAVLCRYFDVPFFVACPSSTFDPSTATGADVEIEQRAPDEVLNGRSRHRVDHRCRPTRLPERQCSGAAPEPLKLFIQVAEGSLYK
jgi:methylthioribose-1-phosphate isomerase